MNISVTELHENEIQVALSGELDAHGCRAVREDLENVASLCRDTVLNLDLRAVSFIDSSGIGAIVYLFKRLRNVGGKLKVINVQGQPQELLTLLRVGEAIPVEYASEDSLA